MEGASIVYVVLCLLLIVEVREVSSKRRAPFPSWRSEYVMKSKKNFNKRSLQTSKGQDVMQKIIDLNKKATNRAQGDIVPGNNNSKTEILHCGHKNVIDVPLWPIINGVVELPYTFKWTGKHDLAETWINITIDHLNRLLRPRFKIIPRTKERYYVRFQNGGVGCFARIGRCTLTEQPQYVNIAEECISKGIIGHEIFHTLGFPHEQSRWDRDNFVTILDQNIEKGKERNFWKTAKPADYAEEVKEHGPRAYDYHSLMHYGRKAFAINGTETIIPKQKGIEIGQQIGLTKHDVQELFQLYGFDIPAVGDLDCDFDSEKPWCHYTHEKGWMIERAKYFKYLDMDVGYEDHTYGHGTMALCRGKDVPGIASELSSKKLGKPSPPYCVKFAFAMGSFHKTMVVGKFEVLERLENGAEKVLWQKSGDQGLPWKVAEVQLQPSKNDRQLVFRVTNPKQEKGKNNSDILLDDIFFDEGMCPQAYTEDQSDKDKQLLDQRDRNVMIL